MRSTLLAASALAAATVSPAAAQPLDPNDPSDALTISRRIMCSTVDAEPAVFA